MYLPGCPPRPEMLIDAILKLHDKIKHEPLGPRRRQGARAACRSRSSVASVGEVRRRLTTDDAAARSAMSSPTVARTAPARCPTSAARRPAEVGRPASSSAGHVRRRTAAATPPASAAWSAGRGRRRRPSGRTAATSTRSPTRWRRRTRTSATRSTRWSSTAARSPSTCAASTCSSVCRRCGTTRRCASSCAPASPASTTSTRPGPAARRLPPDLDDLPPADPARGRRHRRGPARPVGDRVYPTADWHERET